MGVKFRSAKEENNFTMLPFSLLFVAAYATEEADMYNCWPANEHAPYCGCQLITRDYDMINATCSATFSGNAKVHMFSVASSYAVPEQSDSLNDYFVWTGYDGLSHENLHDIIYFFEKEACYDSSYDPVWYNISMPDADYKPTISCVPYTDMSGDEVAWPGPRLGNFNYDIGRSVQQYNMPIYGLDQGQTVTVTVNQMAESTIQGLELMNVTAHHGHGTATAADCANAGTFVYTQNADHQGELEYATFSLCDSACWPDVPNDYCFNVPSSWDSQIV